MGGPETYKQFESDTASIATTTTGHDTIRLGKSTFRKRDLVLGGIALIALILVLALAITLAVEVSNNSDSSSSSVSSSASSSPFRAGLCSSLPCMKAAIRAREFMNQSVDPCEDFYSYACGGYAAANPQTPHFTDVETMTQVDFENTERIVYMINSPVDTNTTHSYEKKMKLYMQACMNHFDKMELRGRPFVQNVVDHTPGWYLFGEFNTSLFDLQSVLKTVHINYWTTAFFSVVVAPQPTDWTKFIVELEYSGLGLPSPIFYYPGYYLFEQSVYKQYIQHIAALITYDKDPMTPADPNRINIFATDVFELEQQMALALLDRSGLLNPYINDTKITLEQVNTDLNDSIDMIDYMKTMFNEHPNLFTKDTEINVYRENFFINLGSYLNALMATDAGRRKIHNYLMWQLLNRYTHELSWDYIHAKRKVVALTTGAKDTTDGTLACLLDMDNAMPDAMSAIFIKHYVKESTKMEGERVLKKIKEELLQEVDRFAWMTPSNRDDAKSKLRETLYKVGYADFMADEDFMDRMYQRAQFVQDDYFGNVLRMNTLRRKRLNDIVGHRNIRLEWRHLIWYPAVDYYNAWHEMTVTYGMLQNPLFSAKGPSYYNYGGVGSLMAEKLMHALDQFGNMVKLDRSGYGTWWSNSTLNKYNVLKQCAGNMVKDLPLGPYLHPDSGAPYVLNATDIYMKYAPILLSEATGIRLSYRAYMKDRPTEALPGVFTKQTKEKLFFLSYAQLHCRNTPDYVKASQARSLNLRGKERVNAALTQVPEFTRAFNCPSTAKLANTDESCVLFK